VKIAGKTEKLTKFIPESAWNKIEEWADEMKDYNLCRKVFMLTSLPPKLNFI
jgi:valyl-tRNA synthetase